MTSSGPDPPPPAPAQSDPEGETSAPARFRPALLPAHRFRPRVPGPGLVGGACPSGWDFAPSAPARCPWAVRTRPASASAVPSVGGSVKGWTRSWSWEQKWEVGRREAGLVTPGSAAPRDGQADAEGERKPGRKPLPGAGAGARSPQALPRRNPCPEPRRSPRLQTRDLAPGAQGALMGEEATRLRKLSCVYSVLSLLLSQ